MIELKKGNSSIFENRAQFGSSVVSIFRGDFIRSYKSFKLDTLTEYLRSKSLSNNREVLRKIVSIFFNNNHFSELMLRRFPTRKDLKSRCLNHAR